MGELPTVPGVLAPAPPSSAYCRQRSASIVSNACRKRRIAASPLLSLPLSPSLSRANARDGDFSRPMPTVAAPAAATPFFKNDRRLEDNPAETCGSFFFISLSPLLTRNHD